MVVKFEGNDIIDFLTSIFNQMKETISMGLKMEGEILPKLHISRVAKQIFEKANRLTGEEKETLLLSSYAYAVSESNLTCCNMVTAPTCGSGGVLPSILYHCYNDQKFDLNKIIKGLMISGLIGLIIKKNASISGAMCGCQAEIGSACCMAASALCYMNDLSLHQIEYASEIAMEHNLGLTCDPVLGYVAIPCIERNAIAALKAKDAYIFAKDIAPLRKNSISLDQVIKVMYETGLSLPNSLKETSKGGLAKVKLC